MFGDFCVGEWQVQPAVNRLRRGEDLVRLEPKVMHVLVRLAEAGGEVVTRDELIARVWSDVHVTDDVLHRAIRELRRVFGDTPATPTYIETIRKRGYRLLPDVVRASSPPARAESQPSDSGPSTPVDRTAPDAPAHRTAPDAPDAPDAPVHRTAPIAPDAPFAPALFPLLAAVLVMACFTVIALLLRPTAMSTEAHARFVPVVSGPFNESDPAISPDGHRVAYVVREGGADTAQADIYYLPKPGASHIRLTASDADDRYPAWSPDGTRIALVRLTPGHCDVYVHTIDTNAEQRVASCANVHEPRVAWSADGHALLLSEAPSSNGLQGWRIVRMALTTGERTPLSHAPAGAIGDHSPVVSPDGRTVAFIRHSSSGVADVYSVPLDGGTARRLTFDEADLTGVDWTAGGRALVYSSDRAGGYSLWRVPAEGGEPQFVAGGAARLKHPVSARGFDRVVYESWNYEINIWQVGVRQVGRVGQVGQVGQVGVPPHDGLANAKPIIRTSELWNLYPQISPDGTRLAYVSTQSGSHELWLASRDGLGAQQLTAFGREPGAMARGAAVRAPRWSPDGRRLVFSAYRNGAPDVFVIDIESRAVTRITSDPWTEISPSWSRDGRRIYYGARQAEAWNVWARSVDGGEPTVMIRDAFAAQAAPDTAAWYFTRADRPGLWRVPDAGGSPTLVVESIGTGDGHNWVVTARGIFFISRDDRNIVLRHAALDGSGVATVTPLVNLSWSGLTVSADGQHALYARWDRRESNLMSIELSR